MNYIEAIQMLEEDKIHGMVLIHGEENYLIDYFVNVLKEAVLTEGFEDFNYDRIESSNPMMSKIIESCETLPFGMGKRIVEVRGIDLSRDGMGKHKEFFDELESYASELDDHVILIIVSESGKLFKGSFTKKAQEHSIIIDMAKLNRRDFSGFINKQFAAKGIRLRSDILNYIIDRSGYLNADFNKSLYDVQNELDKLTSRVSSGSTIDKGIVDGLMISSVEKNIFEMTDAISIGNTNKAINSFLNINMGKDDNYLALHMIIRLFRNILNIKDYKHEGLNKAEIMKRTGISNFEFGKLSGFEARIDRKTILDIYDILYDVEVNLKSSVGNFEDNMLYLISSITTKIRSQN